MNWAFSLLARTELTPTDKLVLLRLADRADPEGSCFPAVETTARDLGVSETCARAALRRLEAVGLITRLARFDPSTGRQRTNLYHLTIEEGADSAPSQFRRRRAPDFGEGRVRNPTPREGADSAPEPKEETKQEPPPPGARSRARLPDGGEWKDIEFARGHGLSMAQAHRFARAVRGVSETQRAVLRHELPLRLPTARDRAATAIGLAQLAARGELDDTTAAAREAAQRAVRRRAEEVSRLESERAAEAARAARRSVEGPTPQEIAARQKLRALRAEVIAKQGDVT